MCLKKYIIIDDYVRKKNDVFKNKVNFINLIKNVNRFLSVN